MSRVRGSGRSSRPGRRIGLACLEYPALSRVHLLVVESEGAFWAIDAASKNGSWHGAEPIRRLRLEPGRRLSLAGHVSLEGCPFH